MRQLEHAEQDMNAERADQRKMLQRLRLSEARLEIADAMKERAAVRKTLLLPEKVAGRG